MLKTGPAILPSALPQHSPARRHFVLGRRAGLAVSAGVVAHTLWTSAAPAMAYRLYAQEWHLSHTVTTEIFAIYPLIVVAVLIGFGDLSDHIGRRTTMLLGLAASLTGALIFANAPSVGWLFAARAFMGLGVGLTAGPSTAAVVEFSAAGISSPAALVTTVAQAAGFAAALLLGGVLIQYAPWPMHLCFWVLALLLGVLFAASWFLPRHTHAETKTPWRPRLPIIPQGMRWEFTAAALAMMTAYTHGVLVLSLGGQVAHDLIRSRNAFTNGAVLSLFAIMSGLAGIFLRQLAARRAMAVGALLSAVGMSLFAWAAGHQSLLIFLLATSTSGAGYSLLFLSALAVINHAAPSHHRAGVLSAVYLFAYLSLGAVALILGAVATARGLAFAIDLGVGVIIALSLTTLLLAATLKEFADRTYQPNIPHHREGPHPPETSAHNILSLNKI